MTDIKDGEEKEKPVQLNAPAEKPQSGSESATNPGPAAASGRKIKKLDPVVAKTLLDTDACRSVVTSSHTIKELRLQEKLETQPQALPKPSQPIEKYCQAAPCNSQWDPKATTKRFQVCEGCQLHIYDFSKMDMQEVCNLVFSREGKEKPRFFKRQDGKFMTTDCPVGKARKRQQVMLIGAALVLLFGLFLISNLSAPTVTNQNTKEIAVSKDERTSNNNEVSKTPEPDQTKVPIVVRSSRKSKSKEYDPTAIYREGQNVGN